MTVRAAAKWIFFLLVIQYFIWKPSGVFTRISGGEGLIADYAIALVPLIGLFTWIQPPQLRELSDDRLPTQLYRFVSFAFGLAALGVVGIGIKWGMSYVFPEPPGLQKIIYIKVRDTGTPTPTEPFQFPVGTRIRSTCADCVLPNGALGTVIEPLHMCHGKFQYTTRYDNYPGQWCDDPKSFEPIAP